MPGLRAQVFENRIVVVLATTRWWRVLFGGASARLDMSRQQQALRFAPMAICA